MGIPRSTDDFLHVQSCVQMSEVNPLIILYQLYEELKIIRANQNVVINLTALRVHPSFLFLLQNGGVAHFHALFHTGIPQKGLRKGSHEAFCWTHIYTVAFFIGIY